MDAITATEGEEAIRDGNFDLYLVSPQTTMYLEGFQK